MAEKFDGMRFDVRQMGFRCGEGTNRLALVRRLMNVT